ncbi:mRNA cleavage and polyadenylation specificity factor complex subunit [Grosmannia clavigera kw1407]|uniref:mRNA cleavage and polyadenylation specificity factor complex subunit n=1 Tax=Grosmannia clavigera (strain kw1407 / UAMH 11150) TaxID=655863 RepID=F0XUZ9_GROCL|nr:mRNA cleavage and polyadenylation specificity factor complex subunit [Grosmannia clavigera kw1407]EFW98981.1 mRNA cleavage and polyadenylation specificity factor complex subunit [Grosmannia clavigera kw1407]
MATASATKPTGAAMLGISSGGTAAGRSSLSASSSSSAVPSSDSVQEQIRQLNDARKLVLANVSYYPTIVQGILPILSPASLPQLRRWGAEFLAEAFAAPALPSRDKETLSLLVLESLKGMVENANEDALVLQSIVQAAASIYPLVMRWIINNSYDTPTWERMTAIKSRILRLWESPVPSVQICCIKFAQRVVLAQTHGVNQEHKRDGLDISLGLISQGHPLLDPRHLEAEATGLLDRMLGVLQDNSSDALIVDATLNTLSILIRTRPTTSSRAINAILSFNPLKLASGHMTPRTRVVVRSMEKTTRMLLIHLTKRDPHNPFNARIHQHIERLMRSRAEMLDDGGRKRALADQQAAAYGDTKRQRLATGAAAPQMVEIKPLAPGQNSLADIFALTSNAQQRAFSASQVPLDLAAKISVSTLARVDQQLLDRAIQGIRDRLVTLEAASTHLSLLNPDTTPLDVADDDDDDYEPDFSTAEDAEQILNKFDMDDGTGREVGKADVGAATAAAVVASLALGAFHLPVAPPLSAEQAVKVGEATVARVFDTMQSSSDVTAAAGGGSSSGAVALRKAGKTAGLGRVAASSFDRESWTTILTRLATRSLSGLEGEAEEEDGGGDEKAVTAAIKREGSDRQAGTLLNDSIRESLFRYVLEDFRKRIDVAVAWLCEEWYNDQLERKYGKTEGSSSSSSSDMGGRHYDKWALRLLDGFLPYLHGQDNKVLTRFLSEIPTLSRGLLQRVKSLCRDPSMVPVALTSLLYQLMMRPPARALTLDTMEEIWIEYEDARPMATKYLDKWRPGFVQGQRAAEESSSAEKAEGVAVVAS